MSTTQAMNFDKYAQEGNAFVNELGEALGHPSEEDRAQVTRLLRSVLHALRDHVSTGLSLHIISQLPMFLKAVYVDQWHYQEKPERIHTMEAFTDKVKHYQRQMGEVEFDWEERTAELVKDVLLALKKYISQGEMKDVSAELPAEIKQFWEQEVL